MISDDDEKGTMVGSDGVGYESRDSRVELFSHSGDGSWKDGVWKDGNDCRKSSLRARKIPSPAVFVAVLTRMESAG